MKTKFAVFLGILFWAGFIHGSSIDSSLLLHMPINGSINDAGPYRLVGSLQGGASFTIDRNGNSAGAVAFDGIDDFIRVPNSPILQSINAPFTFSAWVRVDGYFINYWIPFLGKSSSSSMHFVFAQDRNNDWWTAPQPSCGGLQGSSLPGFGNWYHLAFVRTLSSIKIYVNGQLLDDLSCSNAIVPTSDDLLIGAEPYSQLEFFKGAMDDIRLYNRALTEWELWDVTSTGSILSEGTPYFSNPVKSEVLFFDKVGEERIIRIYSTGGQLIKEAALLAGEQKMSVGEIGSGIYWIQRICNNKIHIGKLVIE
jgi:hypothetical protein